MLNIGYQTANLSQKLHKEEWKERKKDRYQQVGHGGQWATVCHLVAVQWRTKKHIDPPQFGIPSSPLLVLPSGLLLDLVALPWCLAIGCPWCWKGMSPMVVPVLATGKWWRWQPTPSHTWPIDLVEATGRGRQATEAQA